MTVDVKAYIASAPEAQRPLLRELDAAIRNAFPDAALDPKSYFPVYGEAGAALRRRHGRHVSGSVTVEAPPDYVEADAYLLRVR